MPAGLTVYNNNGQFQIDENYFTWAVVAYGSIYAGQNLGGLPDAGKSMIRRITLAAPADTVFAIYNPTGAACIYRAVYSGGVWTVDFALAQDTNNGVPIGNDNGAKWFALHRPAAVGGTKYGLEVYDASGNRLYNSFNKSKSPVVPTGNPANKYAFIGGVTKFEYYLEIEPDTNNTSYYSRLYYMIGGRSANGTVIEANVLYQQITESRPGGSGGGSFVETDGVVQPRFVIDVTEFI